MEKREGGEVILGRAVGMEELGFHPPGRSRRTWRQCADEDLAILDTEKAEAMGRDSWKCIIDRRAS